MIPAPTPPNETCRLAALHELGILDTPPEERFDRITRMARRLFDTPMALVSLVDADRQWFKSRAGLEATQTARNVSFCGHTILRDEVMIVPDASLDPRFSDNPLVVGEPRIRFYAGCPLHGRNREIIGTLCVIDTRPRHLGGEDLDMLRDLAETVEQQLVRAEAATVDFLTGLTNRRGFEVVADYVLGLSRRKGTSACALMFDLDGFKQINDVHGHAAGDRALVHFARALSAVFRESDVVARLAGDEFCVMMTEATRDVAFLPIRRLDDALVGDADEPWLPVRYSVGAAQYDPERHRDLGALLDEADRAMYENKRTRHADRDGRVPA